ncbi:MAG TPA: ATP synthase F1 subunit gamma [Terriglobia bacterium]|nr:ATP synthase F1 subunit gamma [Terriglobia bacterium]
MPSLLDIRRRIRSVKNTQQLTKAMKTVSAAKLRRAQERVVSARPYAEQLRRVLANLAKTAQSISHPLLESRPEERVLIVIVTADRGLCGAFNSNLIRATQNLLREHSGHASRLYTVGRKGRDFFKRRAVPSAGEYINFFSRLDYGNARDISAHIVDLYTKQEVDAVYLVYNEFKSVIQQRVAVEKLLPLAPVDAEPEPQTAGKYNLPDYIYEQPPQEVFNRLLPRYVETQVYRALLESAASEHGARMAAMDTASRNAGEMIETLTLNMNRIRQAAITREIIEVVSGAGAQ